MSSAFATALQRDCLPRGAYRVRSQAQIAAASSVTPDIMRKFMTNERGLRISQIAALLDPRRGDSGLARAVLGYVNHVAVIPLRNQERAPHDALAAYAVTLREDAEHCAEVAAAIEDGAVTRDEYARIEAEFIESIHARYELMGVLRDLSRADGRAKTMKEAE